MPLLDRRIGLLFAVFLGLLSLAFLRAVYFGTVRGDSLSRVAATQQVSVDVVPARRGSLVDRHGVPLAVSEPASDVSVTPYLVKDPARTADRLSPLVGKPSDELLKQLTRRDTGFAYLARGVPASRADRIERARLPGVALTPVERREYPRAWLASQVIGSVGTDDAGLSGLEYARNSQLAGAPGRRRVVRDALGQPLQLRDLELARPGARLGLTLDSAMQDKVEQVLAGVGERYKPKGATAIVTDPRSGEVLAMANWPRVDANDLSASPDYARQNRATGFTFEPGSTFKAFTIAGALEEGKVKPDTLFDLPPQIQVADRTIGESHVRGPVTLTTSQILAQSSNVGAIKVGATLGKRRFDAWVRRFGFGKRTGVDLPGEERGLILPVSDYSGSSMGNLPIGQGESVTPMQMATAYGAIANGGILRPAQLVRRIDGRPVPRPAGRRIISPQVSTQLREMLKGVVSPGGTAAEVAIPGYELAGKTGTANKVDPKTGEYSKARYVASFVGFAPARQPRLLISVVVDEPQGAIYGGVVAAPAFGQIASFALPYLRIAPE